MQMQVLSDTEPNPTQTHSLRDFGQLRRKTKWQNFSFAFAFSSTWHGRGLRRKTKRGALKYLAKRKSIQICTLY